MQRKMIKEQGEFSATIVHSCLYALLENFLNFHFDKSKSQWQANRQQKVALGGDVAATMLLQAQTVDICCMPNNVAH